MMLLHHVLLTAALVTAVPAPKVVLPAFQQASFDAAMKSGTPLVVIVAATWCPVCKAQEVALSRLLATPELKGVQVVRVDFEDQAAVVKALRVESQSTIVAFKGGKEVGRWVGETNQDRIAIMMKRTL
jgi:thioredoxin 1